MSDVHTPQPVTCLSIDVAKSTQTGNLLSPARRFAYQSAIIDLIDKYIPELGFIEYQAKFTGDGWLIFSPYNDDIDKLVVLGKTVCHLYPDFVRDLVTGVDSAEPAVRACICSGQDFAKLVKQQDGSAVKDWLGDSARRASSLASCAHSHELLVDQPVNDRIELIFQTHLVDKGSLPPGMKPKHDGDRPVWRVGELKHADMDPSESAAPYISYLNWTGQEEESAQLITAAINAVLKVRKKGKAAPAPPSEQESDASLQRAVQIDTLRKLLRAAPDEETASFAVAQLTELGAPPTIEFFNALIENAPDYGTAIRRYAEVGKAGIDPDERTFDILIGIARDYATATRWLAEMTKSGMQPLSSSFNTLINKAPDYATATRWFAQMNKLGASPDAGTFDGLVRRAPDHATAARWFDAMTKAEVSPGAETFNRLITTSPDAGATKHWQSEMTKAGFARS